MARSASRTFVILLGLFLSQVMAAPVADEKFAASDLVGPQVLGHLSGLPSLQEVLGADLGAFSVTGADVQVTSDPANTPQNEPSVAIHPINSSWIVAGANDYRLVAQGFDAWAGIYVSKDAGGTWSNGLLPGYPGGPSSPLTGFDTAGDPGLDFDKNGVLYYSGIAFNRAGTGARDGTVFTARSTNLGTTFSTVIVAPGSGNTFNDKPYLAVDRTSSSFGGRVYVSFTQFRSTTGRILLSFSSNGGQTFSSPITLSNSGLNQGSIPAIGPNGEVYVAWRDISNNQVKIVKSTNGGVTFTTPKVVANMVPIPNPLPNTSFRTNSHPTLAVDPQKGTVSVAWNDYRNGNSDILLATSTDGALTFSTPIRVNDDAGNNDQFFPWLQSHAGRISAVFYDRRLDTFNHDLDVFYADSTDDGQTFSPNLRVTDQSVNPDVQFQGQFIGDYIGLALTSERAFPVWTDTRSLNQDIFTDKVAIAVHDTSVASLSVSPNTALQGQMVAITVVAENGGTFSETFVVTASDATASIGSATVSNLAPGLSQTLFFFWDTAGATPGLHVITVTAVPVMGETTTQDNSIVTTVFVKSSLGGSVSAASRRYAT